MSASSTCTPRITTRDRSAPTNRAPCRLVSTNLAPCRSSDELNAATTSPSLAGVDRPRDDPPVLADLAVALEAQPLVGGERPVEQETGGHRRGVLRVALHPAAPEPGDQVERAGQACRGDALTTVALAGV